MKNYNEVLDEMATYLGKDKFNAEMGGHHGYGMGPTGRIALTLSMVYDKNDISEVEKELRTLAEEKYDIINKKHMEWPKQR